MAKVNLKHSGAVIDQQIDRCIDGSVVVDNTLSALDLESKKPVDSQGIASAIEAASNSLKARGYIYMGVATPTTKPNTTAGKVFYLAAQAGEYTNFGYTLPTDALTSLEWDGERWFAVRIADLVTPAEVKKAILDNTASEVTGGGTNPVSGSAVASAISGEKKVTEYGEYREGTFVHYGTGKLYVATLSDAILDIDVGGASSLRLLFNTSESDSSSGIAFFDENGKFISGVQVQNTGVVGVTERIIPVPLGAKTCSTTILKSHISQWYCYKQYEAIDADVQFSGKGFCGALSTSDGTLTITSDNSVLTRRVSNFIHLGDASIILINCQEDGVSIGSLFWYDSNGTLLKYETGLGSRAYKYPVADATYLRLFFMVPSSAYGDTYKIKITARYKKQPPREIPYEISVGGINTVKPTLVFTRPKNAAINIEDTNVSDSVLYGNEPGWAKYTVYLPPNYTPEGEPVRLIIYMNGSGVVNQSNTSAANKPFVDYFNAQGYAVAFVPNPWGLNSQMTGSGNEFWGTPTNYAIYAKFYKNLLKRFNFKPEVFMYGKSHGGFQLSSVPYVVNIPTLAISPISCTFFTLRNMWGYNDKQRIESMTDFGFSGMETDSDGKLIGEAKVMLYQQDGAPNYGNNTGYTDDRKQYILTQADKLIGLMVDSIGNTALSVRDFINEFRQLGITGFAQLNPKKITLIPHLCFVAKDDTTIYGETVKFQTMINGANGYCRLRLMPSGTENPHNAATTLAPTMEVATKYGGTMTIPITAAEMLEFFQRYEV